MTRIVQTKNVAAQQLRRKALQPEERYCRILRKRVTILVEYPDYHSPMNKGPDGEIYCSNIIECYQNNVQCRYSGISPLYPDPFEGVPRDVREAERMFGPPEPSQPEPLEEEEELAEQDEQALPEPEPAP